MVNAVAPVLVHGAPDELSRDGRHRTALLSAKPAAPNMRCNQTGTWYEIPAAVALRLRAYILLYINIPYRLPQVITRYLLTCTSIACRVDIDGRCGCCVCIHILHAYVRISFPISGCRPCLQRIRSIFIRRGHFLAARGRSDFFLSFFSSHLLSSPFVFRSRSRSDEIHQTFRYLLFFQAARGRD